MPLFFIAYTKVVIKKSSPSYKYLNHKSKDFKDYLVIKEVFENNDCMYGFPRLKKVILQKQEDY